MRIHQVLAAAAPGEAVADTALGYRSLLRRIGPSEVYAASVSPELADDVLTLDDWDGPGERPEDLLVVHASIGEPAVAAFLTRRRARLVVVAHPMPPARYYRSFDASLAERLSFGRSELAGLRARAVLALGVSAAGARELVALGFADVRVSPLPVDVSALVSVEPDPVLTKRLNELKGPLVICAGEVLPSTRPDLVLKAHHVLSTYLQPDAHLAIIGATPLEGYRAALVRMAEELKFPDAPITGWLPPAERAAYYRRADVFVTLSEHEGTGAPVLEAMAFNVPVVARSSSSLPDIIGDAGLLLPDDDDPLLAAEAVHAVLTDDALRAGLIARGRARKADFSVERAQAAFLGHIASVA